MQFVSLPFLEDSQQTTLSNAFEDSWFNRVNMARLLSLMNFAPNVSQLLNMWFDQGVKLQIREKQLQMMLFLGLDYPPTLQISRNFSLKAATFVNTLFN